MDKLLNLWENFYRFFEDHEPNFMSIAVLLAFVVTTVMIAGFILFNILRIIPSQLLLTPLVGWIGYSFYYFWSNGYISFRGEDE